MFELIFSKIKSLIYHYDTIQHPQKPPFFLKEKIGNPDLFTGRKKELSALLIWVDKIKQETSKSTAIISRRKTGKTAVMQRLFNIVFNLNNGVIPFYFEIDRISSIHWIRPKAIRINYFAPSIGYAPLAD
jgi:hypothetical protein